MRLHGLHLIAGAIQQQNAGERMTMWPVSPKLNSPKNDSPDLLESIEKPGAAAQGEVTRANEGMPKREPTNPD